MSLANINLSTFTYKKATGATSARTVVIVEEDADRILALEVEGGDLTPIQPYLAYNAELEELKEQLKAKHGLDSKKLPYKSFLLGGVSKRNDLSLTVDL